jgi:hypothetical protein
MEISSRKNVGAQLIMRNNGLAILIMACHYAANFHGATLFKITSTWVAMAATKRPHPTCAQKRECL